MAQKRVLVIEDDEKARMAIKAALESAGYDVEASLHLVSAIGAALSGDYSLITLDPGVPGIGRQEVEEMLQLGSVVTPVLVVSDSLDDAKVRELQELGVRHFLSKPFHTEDLLRAVETAVFRGGR